MLRHVRDMPTPSHPIGEEAGIACRVSRNLPPGNDVESTEVSRVSWFQPEELDQTSNVNEEALDRGLLKQQVSWCMDRAWQA